MSQRSKGINWIVYEKLQAMNKEIRTLKQIQARLASLSRTVTPVVVTTGPHLPSQRLITLIRHVLSATYAPRLEHHINPVASPTPPPNSILQKLRLSLKLPWQLKPISQSYIFFAF